MAKLYNLKSAYELVNSLYGITPDPDNFEDVALAGWEQIGNKHTRLYKFVGNTTNQELQLPCNADIVESVTIPISDANMTSNKTDLLDFESVMVESYIDSFPTMDSPFNTKGKLIKYKEGDGILYFDRDYNNVTVVYHGILCDEDDGLPLINDREMKAIAAFVAWREMLKDCLKRGTTSKYGLALVQTVEAEWLRKCNAARLTDHLTQNDMNAILDAKFNWNRKNYNKSFKPII